MSTKRVEVTHHLCKDAPLRMRAGKRVQKSLASECVCVCVYVTCQLYRDVSDGGAKDQSRKEHEESSGGHATDAKTPGPGKHHRTPAATPAQGGRDQSHKDTGLPPVTPREPRDTAGKEYGRPWSNV